MDGSNQHVFGFHEINQAPDFAFEYRKKKIEKSYFIETHYFSSFGAINNS